MPRALLIIASLLALAGPSTAQPVFSVVLENGRVIDGTGSGSFTADVGIIGDRVAAIGDLSNRRAARRIDASGLVVAPGFIDIHSHLDSGDAGSSPVARRPLAENYIRQGVTTAFGGQDGGSPYPIGTWLSHFDAEPSAINVGLFVGHGTVRGQVVGLEDRPATVSELEAMQHMVQKAMSDGAFGLSSGLEYSPGMFADTDELVALASVTAPYGGVYISHVRDEGGRLMASVEEVIEIAGRAGIAGQLTHHKIIGKGRWGGTQRSLASVDSARQAGLDITLDVYPYTASSTSMMILFPAWSKDGGLSGLQARLAVRESRDRIRQDVIDHINSERGGDPSTIVVARCSFDPSLDGLSLQAISEARGLPGNVPAGADIAIELVERGNCQGVFHSMSEEDVVRVIQHPMSMISSDGGVPELGSGSPHPRNYGTFARVLARYARDRGDLDLESAVHKMTGSPASRAGLADRGVLRIGAVADITVFDPSKIQDHATFGEPHQYATGVLFVLVGGQIALADGEPTGLRPGRALRK